MGWLNGSKQHDGYAASVLDDGTVTSEFSQQIAARVAGWRAACHCQGSPWLGPTFYQARASDGGIPPAEIENQIHQEWAAHVAPFDALEQVTRCCAEVDQAEHRLNEVAASARSVGVSWERIGQAAGMSKQAAHKRWSTPPRSGAADA